jgi:hypothetical protein
VAFAVIGLRDETPFIEIGRAPRFCYSTQVFADKILCSWTKKSVQGQKSLYIRKSVEGASTCTVVIALRRLRSVAPIGRMYGPVALNA